MLPAVFGQRTCAHAVADRRDDRGSPKATAGQSGRAALPHPHDPPVRESDPGRGARNALRKAAHEPTAETTEDPRRRPEVNPGGASRVRELSASQRI